MKVCFYRLLLAAASLVIALVWWATSWAKIVVVLAAALLALASLLNGSCRCRMKQGEGGEVTTLPSSPTPD